VSNTWYVRNKPPTTIGPLAYGDPIAATDLATNVMVQWSALWAGHVSTGLCANYTLDEYIIRSIVGWKFKAPVLRVIGVAADPLHLAEWTFTTATPNGYKLGQNAITTGFSSLTPAINGVSWTITRILSPYSFNMVVPTLTGVYGLDGFVQVMGGKQTLVYGDKVVQAGNGTTDNGQLAAPALALFDTMSVDKVASQAGKNFRGGIRLGPQAESSWVNGTIKSAVLAGYIADLHHLVDPVSNGSADATAGLMYACSLSKQLLFQQPEVLLASDPFMSYLVDAIPRPNNGSLRRRKPKLLQPIIQP